VERLLRNTLSSISTSKKIGWKKIARAIEGNSAALVVKIANNAAKLAVISGKKMVTEQNLLDSLGQMKSLKK